MEEIERNMNKMKISNRNLYFYDSSPGNLPFYKNNNQMSGINKINTRRVQEGFMPHEIEELGQAKNMFILPFLMNIMNHIKLNIHSGENISELEKIYQRAGSVNITNDFVNVVWDFTEVRVFFDKFSYYDHAAAGAFVRRALANVSSTRAPTFRNNSNNTFNNRNIRKNKYHPLYDNDIIPLLNKTSLNRDGRSFTILHYASLLGLPKTVEFLLNNGANPFLQILTSSTPPLPPKISPRDLTNEIKNIYLSKLNDDYVETFTDYAYNSRGPLRVTVENYEKTISNLEKGEENYTNWKNNIENTLKTDENRIIDGRNDVAKKITSFLGGKSKYSKKTRKKSKKHSIRKTKRKLAGTSKEEAARDLIDFAKNAHISDYYDKHDKDEYLMVKQLRKGKYVTIPPAPKKVFDSEEEAVLFVYKYLNDNSLLAHNLLYLYDKDEIMSVMHYLKDKKMTNNGYYQYSSFKSKDDFATAPAPAPPAPFVMPPPVGPAPPAPAPFVMPNFQKGGVIYVDDENDRDSFMCPLSLDIMTDPVIAEDGFTYEREHIENWINTPRQAGQQLISPLTSEPMGINIIPNKSLKKIIDASVFDREPTLSASTEMQTENNETASTEMQTENNETTPIETQTPQNIVNEIYAENEDAILDEALNDVIEDTFNENIDIVSEEEENKNIVKEILEEILTVDLNKKLQKRKKKNKKKASKQRKQQEMTKEEEVRKLVDKAKAIEAIEKAKLAEAKADVEGLGDFEVTEQFRNKNAQEALGNALNINWNMLMEKCNLSMNGFLPNQMESAIIVDFYIHAASEYGYAHVQKEKGAIEELNIPYLIGEDAYQFEDLRFAKSGLVDADSIENELTNWMKDVVNAHVRLSDAANSASVEVTSMLSEEIVSNYPTNYSIQEDMKTSQIYEKTENHIRHLHKMNIEEEQQTLHYGAELRPEPRRRSYSVRGLKRKTNNLETKFMDAFFFWGHCITLIESMPKDELEKFANSDFYLKMTVEKMFHLVGTTPISEWDFGMVKRGLRVGSICAAAKIAAWIRRLLPIRLEFGDGSNELLKEIKKLEEVQKLIISKVDANVQAVLELVPQEHGLRGGGPLGPIAQALEPQEEDTSAESTETQVDIVGGAGDLPDDRKELKEMCAKAGIPYSSKEGIERIKKRLRALPPSPTQEAARQRALADARSGRDLPDDRKELKEMCAKAGIPYSSKDGIGRLKSRLRGLPSPTRRQHRCVYADRGAFYSLFPKLLHKLLTNQEYSNIISWKNDNDGNVLIVLKDKLLVAKELCPRANYGEAVMRSQFSNYGFNRISGRGDNEWVFSNPKVKSIDDILTLRSLEARRARRDAEAQRRVNSPTIDDRDRDIANVLMQLNNQSPQSTDMAAMAVPRHVLLEHDEQGDLHSVGEESADMADMAAPRHVLLELDEQGDLHSVGEESADMDNNEAANVLASITNINDENTENLDRRTSYLQNLNTNNEHSLKIALLIESLKNHVIDENEKNQIKQKQNELWQGLKEIPMEDEQRRGVLYKYMFEYLKRTIPQAKLNEGAKIAKSNFESIKRAQIHNRPTKPLTESEQKQADEETNAAISRGQMLAQDEDTNMEDVQSPNTQLEPPSGEALKLREEVAQLMQENEQLKAHKASKTPHPAPEPEAPTEAPKPKRRQIGVVPTPGTRVSVRYQLTPDDQDYEGTVGERLDGRARAMVKFDDGSERPIDFAVPGISITRAPPELAELFDVLEASQSGGAKQADFLINLHKLLTNQEYSNIISWTFDNDGNILILLKDKLLVAKEVCPRSANIDFHSCARQFCNYGFKTETRLSIEGIDKNNGLIFSNPKVKSIDDILTLERKISTKCRKSPTIDDGDRAANVLAQLSSRSTDMDNNEAANVLASIANISDENTEDLDRRISYLQNLNTNNEHSLKIALLIESLKNHVIDENQKKQIKQKQNELWQSLKEIELDNTKRKDILYKYMFEYLKRTIPQAKLNEGAKIAQSNFESIKIAQIHNRTTKPLTESEETQADEETNAAISRGQMLAQDEDTNMEDVQSPNAPFVETPWWRKGGITDKALIRLHSEPVDGHMIEVYYGDHWKLGKAVRKKGRSRMILKPLLNSAGERQAESIRQIVTQVDYIDGTSVDELLHRGDWKQRQNPVKQDLDYFIDNPKYWRYAKSNSRSQSGGVIYVDDENDKMRFECPISTEIMREPVIAEDGYSYEKEEIVNWIKLSEDKGNPITSPITGDNMGKTLIPNTVLKDIIKNSVFDRQRDVESLSQIEDENKNKGIIIQYKDTRFGFIHTFDGIDNLFFHSSQLDNQVASRRRVGDIVSFVIKEYKGKPTATNIKVIESASNRKTGVIVKYNNDKQYGFIEPNINGMPQLFVHISEINQLVSVGDKVSFIIGPNMAGKAVAKKVKIINDEIGVEEEKKEDSAIPQLEQRLLMELIFERDRIMREREKVNSIIKSRK